MIGQYLYELLFQFDTVTIPGFGTFVKSAESVPVHPVETVFSPPSIMLKFDDSKQDNDGVLANYIAEKEKIPFFEALSRIRTFVVDFQLKLETDKIVLLDQIGTFSKSGDQQIFTASQGTSFETVHYGLTSVQAKPIIRDRPVAPTTMLPKKKKAPILKYVLLLFAVLLIIGAAIIFLLKPYKSPKYSEYFKSIPILNEQDNAIGCLQGKKTSTYSSISNNLIRINYNNVPKKESIVEKVEEKQTEISTNVVQANQSGNYLIVAGSFKSKENADNYLSRIKSKGYSPEIILASNGMYMVTYGRYKDINSANADLEKIKSSENPAAWVLKY